MEVISLSFDRIGKVERGETGFAWIKGFRRQTTLLYTPPALFPGYPLSYLVFI